MLTEQQLRPIFESKYNRENWYKVLRENFNVEILREKTIDITSRIKKNEYNAKAFELGNFETKEGLQIGLYEVNVPIKAQLHRNRKGLRDLLAQIYSNVDAALIVFVQDKKWRFSYVSEISIRDKETGERKLKTTDPKRYTYLFGEGEKAKTAATQFSKIQPSQDLYYKGITLDALQEAFNVEKMSKAFFNEYRKHYGYFTAYLTGEDETGTEVGKASTQLKSAFNGKEKEARDFIKKMLGRIVFLYFLEKKGWLGVPVDQKWGDGDENFLSNLFKNSIDKEAFYSNVLAPLFFNALNTKRTDDVFKLSTGEKVKLPFLNGGLFEEDEWKTRSLAFPKRLFADLFEFFDRYNFTVYEDSPDEHTVAVDPEMLGHIFENLLEDNKDKGAYYTPKEIVHYMCQESLLEYLNTALDGKAVNKEVLEKLVKQKDASDVMQWDDDILKALLKVKICDPAIGSGAFPMGLLMEIFYIVETMHFVSPDVTEDVWKLGNHWNPAKVKEQIIQNSIYGVDIEKGAVDIARLRFWLSLVVDEETPQPLPNLDYKIVVGNSLLSKFNGIVIDIDWNPKYKNASAVEKLILDQQKKLYLLPERQRTFFIAHHLDKQKLKKEIRNLKIDILVNQLELTKVQYAENNALINTLYPTPKEQLRNKEIKEQLAVYTHTIEKLKALKKDNDAPLEFFDWKLDFPEVMNQKVNKQLAGFSIVIGNPPWGGGLDKDLKYLKHRYPETTLEHIDSYKLFIDASMRLVKDYGCLTMIVPNTLLRQNRLRDVRKLLLKHKLKTIINLGENIFEEAVVPSCVFICNKEGADENHNVRYYDISKLDKREKGLYLSLLYNGSILKQQTFTENRDLEFAGKILSLSCSYKLLGDFDFFVLKDVGLQCQRKNVGKEARTKSDLATRIFIDKKLNDQSVMYWKGRDINRYNIKQITQRFFRKDFKKLVKENEVVYSNEEVYNTIPKIIFRQTADHLIAALDTDKRWFDGSAIGFIPNKKSDYSILYMLGLFNSSFFKWYYRRLADEEDRVFAQVKLSKVKQLPVRLIDFSHLEEKLLHDQLKKLVSERIANTNATDFDAKENIKTRNIDKAIDRLVYELYNLSYDEACRIEGHNSWMTKEEYENFKI